ncbi:LysR family transcriptional regulator [Herbidospora mongoliensis]|uniref:LysR family transcriptional regulator n=1 Tax=Herbidospora mongoliensis TaxID=688067 RepID=UPI000834AE22|nr:LysR family transcriptional regulator [Herbidospora mongoliensis]
MDLDLGLVADFLVLTEERHYGRAALRLHLTSSALSKRIQRLERQLGVVLIERNPAGVLAVTPEGRRFAADAKPLIAQAGAARENARAASARCTVRLGVPAGTGAILGQIDMGGIAREVRRSFPETRLVRQDIAFPSLTRCLPDHQVDLLWTFAPVRHPVVDSFPLSLASPRVGVVAARHALADAETMKVEDFSEQPILYNPVCPEEWMSQFWLGDIRPRRQARLVETHAGSFTGVLRQAADGAAVIATVTGVEPLLGSAFRAVKLTGAAPVAFHIARRRTDRQGVVNALLEAFRSLSPREPA